MKPIFCQTYCRRFRWLIVLGISLLVTGHLMAQSIPQREGHPLYPAGLPTGYVGQGALLQPLPVQGYFQPVKVLLPVGTAVAFAQNEAFFLPQEAPVQVGLLVGHVYRFQVTGIPYYSGAELYPTLEIINRLYPPPGKEDEFPVEVEITQEDLELALSGRLVTRVIYLEDPLTALATKGEDKVSLSLTLGPTENPLREAQRLGRPMAILRMGNRQYVSGENDTAFFFGSPPLMVTAEPQPLPLQPIILESQSETKIFR